MKRLIVTEDNKVFYLNTLCNVIIINFNRIKIFPTSPVYIVINKTFMVHL